MKRLFCSFLFCLYLLNNSAIAQVKADEYYNEGLRKYATGGYEDAINLYSKSLKYNKKNYYVYYARALAYYYQGKYNEAMKDCDKAIKIKHDYTNAYIT